MSYDAQSTNVQLQPAYILHSRKYRETSLIIDVLTKGQGKVAILAKGVRQKKSKTVGALQLFTLLNISYVGKADLKTLSHVEMLHPNVIPRGISLYSGFYLNELVSVFLPYLDPYPEIFVHYMHCLNKLLNSNDIEAALRIFEMNFLQCLGYGLILEIDYESNQAIVASKRYDYEALKGPVARKDGFISGSTLLALKNEKLVNKNNFREAKMLLRGVIDFHLQGKQLKSRALFAKVINQIKS